MKGHQWVTPGQHYADFQDGTNSWGKEHPKRMPVEDCFVQVHHFKWDETCVERIKKVAENKQDYSYSDEYKVMYNAIKDSNWKIDIKNPKYLVEKLKEFSYINYEDYTNWSSLTEKIVSI